MSEAEVVLSPAPCLLNICLSALGQGVQDLGLSSRAGGYSHYTPKMELVSTGKGGLREIKPSPVLHWQDLWPTDDGILANLSQR